MTETNKYNCLTKSVFTKNEYSIVPIRYQDRMNIMQWRNEQIFHLRQAKPLTEDDQENYFKNIVSKLFEKEQPNQILFSYLENDVCIGYGGLVHINWIDKNAEISFIINTQLEKEFFQKHWGIYLDLIELVAFEELKFHKLFTYAFDLRPHVYTAVEAKGFAKEATLKEHCFFNGEFKNVIIHSKINTPISLRKASISDKQKIFEWANDEVTRLNSFNSEPIIFETHSAWYDAKMKDENAVYFIGEVYSQPAGLVRFDKDKDGSITIGILIDKNFRGKKLATPFLKKACQEYLLQNTLPIFAYIKKENIASIKSFEKAGFVFEKTLKIKNVETAQYKFHKNDK